MVMMIFPHRHGTRFSSAAILIGKRMEKRSNWRQRGSFT
jgi:hypothetical protein